MNIEMLLYDCANAIVDKKLYTEKYIKLSQFFTLKSEHL